MQRLNIGFVGGGEGAFIGPVHRMAAELDGRIRLVCGAFSSDPERSVRSGRTRYGLDPARCYPDYVTMFRMERTRPAGDRMDFVAIVTPNDVHVDPARRALEAGFPVFCDKPLARSLAESSGLAELADRTGLPFAVAHNYTGYPMVKEARALVASGALGRTRRVVVEYLQGWLGEPVELTGQKQASWRTDPRRAGMGCMGDIGTHAANLLEYVAGSRIDEVAAELTTFVGGRAVDDDASVLLRLANGARGVLQASQIASGEENALRLRIYGERGGLDWAQMEPNTLTVRWANGPTEVRRTAGPGTTSAPNHVRLPAGHPEGFIEAFANLYREFADAVLATRGESAARQHDFPTVHDGVRGLMVLDAVARSATRGGVWESVRASALETLDDQEEL